MNFEGIPTKVEDVTFYYYFNFDQLKIFLLQIPFPAFTLVENINDDVKRRDSQYIKNRKESSSKHIVRVKRLVIDDNPSIE